MVINFWVTWCAPCRAEMPELVKLQSEYGAHGLQIIGVTNPPHNRRTVQRVTRQLKINYPILLGTRNLAAKYHVGDVLPTAIIVDRDGKIRDRSLGIIQPEDFKQKVAPLLK